MISSVRNALPDLDTGRRGANHRYYVHTYTLHLLSVMCIWKFGAVSKLCSEKKNNARHPQIFISKLQQHLRGRNDERGAARIASRCCWHTQIVPSSPASLFSFCKLNKMPEASEKASRVELSRLLVDPTWLKSNLIKCIAGILRK